VLLLVLLCQSDKPSHTKAKGALNYGSFEEYLQDMTKDSLYELLPALGHCALPVPPMSFAMMPPAPYMPGPAFGMSAMPLYSMPDAGVSTCFPQPQLPNDLHGLETLFDLSPSIPYDEMLLTDERIISLFGSLADDSWLDLAPVRPRLLAALLLFLFIILYCKQSDRSMLPAKMLVPLSNARPVKAPPASMSPAVAETHFVVEKGLSVTKTVERRQLAATLFTIVPEVRCSRLFVCFNPNQANVLAWLTDGFQVCPIQCPLHHAGCRFARAAAGFVWLLFLKNIYFAVG
jgi:hypothetical protein